MKIKTTLELHPVFTKEAFKAAFAQAKAQWPGVDLGYTGTDKEGNHYFQERGNPEPFVLRK